MCFAFAVVRAAVVGLALVGCAFAAGMMDLRSRAWISRLQDDRGVVILRETTWLPFATSRRSLWTRERGSD